MIPQGKMDGDGWMLVNVHVNNSMYSTWWSNLCWRFYITKQNPLDDMISFHTNVVSMFYFLREIKGWIEMNYMGLSSWESPGSGK